MAGVDEVLRQIDQAVYDFEVSDDAMRWRPDPPAPEPPESGPEWTYEVISGDPRMMLVRRYGQLWAQYVLPGDGPAVYPPAVRARICGLGATEIRFVPLMADPSAPTAAELAAAVPLGDVVHGVDFARGGYLEPAEAHVGVPACCGPPFTMTLYADARPAGSVFDAAREAVREEVERRYDSLAAALFRAVHHPWPGADRVKGEYRRRRKARAKRRR